MDEKARRRREKGDQLNRLKKFLLEIPLNIPEYASFFEEDRKFIVVFYIDGEIRSFGSITERLIKAARKYVIKRDF